jgi:hypothetical protein
VNVSKQQGGTTTDLEIAVKEAGFKDKKAVSRAIVIARDKFEKEGIMPKENTTKKKTRKAKKSGHTDEISKLRADIASLRKQMKALDASLRKEQSSKLLSAIAAKTLRLTVLVGSAASYPARHPISSVRWVGQQVTKPFSWLREAVNSGKRKEMIKARAKIDAAAEFVEPSIA